VSPGQLLAIPLLLPPFAEQQRIVDLIQSADASIGAAIKLSSASALAASRVRDEHFSEPGTTTPAGEFFEITMGRQRSPRHSSGDHVVPYLRAANAKDGRLDLRDVKSMNFSPADQVKYHLEDGDVLITEGCGSLAQLGASAQWRAELPGVVCFQNTLLRVRGVEDRSLSDYAFQWARWCFEAGRFAAVASGTNIFHVGAERAKAMMAPDVTLGEQREFLDAVEALDSIASHARTLAARASDVRLAVLADLLSGDHEIPHTYDVLLQSAS
jgi:type I restriction enzyme, S subunit